jgi:small-conductance mechanosensitive channel
MSALVLQVINQPIYSLEWLRAHGPRIAVLIGLALAISRVASLSVRRLRRRLEGKPTVTGEASLQRVTTLTSTVGAAVRVVAWTVVVLMVLAEVGFDLGPLLAGAGIVGLAIGFGAQSLVKDVVSGFFILLENQFSVGDVVAISVPGGQVDGTVEQMTLRTTAVRAQDGTMSLVPNGNFQVVSNRSRGFGPLVVEVRVPFRDDLGEIGRRLDRELDHLRDDPSFRRSIIAGPDAAAVEVVDQDEVALKVAVETRPYRRSQVEDELRRRVRHGFLAGS